MHIIKIFFIRRLENLSVKYFLKKIIIIQYPFFEILARRNYVIKIEISLKEFFPNFIYWAIHSVNQSRIGELSLSILSGKLNEREIEEGKLVANRMRKILIFSILYLTIHCLNFFSNIKKSLLLN